MGAFQFSNDDWGTIAFSIPKNQINNKFINQELQYCGLYFAVGTEDGIEKIYVGQGKLRNDDTATLTRVREHFKKDKNGNYKEIWADSIHTVIIVTNKNDAWNDAIVSTLERIFRNKIPKENLLNGNEPRGDLRINCDDKVMQIESYLVAIGVNTFSIQDDNNIIQIEAITEGSNTRVEDLHSGMSRIPEIITPHKVVKAMVDLLPESIFNPNTKFLDPACKGGEYLREIYDRLMKSECMETIFKNPIERSNHILSKQLYGIALSTVSLERTKQKLLGFEYNIKIIPNYINILKRKTENKTLMKDIINKEFNGNMKFDVIIGNPPYQEATGGGQSGGVPLYNYFIKEADELEPDYMSFIIPTRWYTDNTRKSSQELRNILLNNKTTKIVDFPNAEVAFKGVNIRGGVMYFLRESSKKDSCEVYKESLSSKSFKLDLNNLNNKLFIRDEIANKIYEQIINSSNSHTAMEIAFKMNPFDLKRADTGDIVKLKPDDIEVISSSGIGYIRKDIITKNANIIDKYKVIVGYGVTSSDKVITEPKILKPNQVCTLTYCVFGVFKDYNTAQKYANYLKTKFVRYLIRASLVNSSITRENLVFVPLLDIKQDWTDGKLYQKYGLTDEEIECIETTIRSMTSTQDQKSTKPHIDEQVLQASMVNSLLNNN